ncbi:SGNH/GDSL hydrolase family protein [Desulfosporosinus sp. SB140]|uniref:SGNH/GDSL hydrolase family protein n=1 Tax=Desulfosporosinus paludis TaxID=3115649 RepID=UPI003890476D
MEQKTVFVLGDSISIHYSPFLKNMISSKFKYQQKGLVGEALKDLDQPNGANAGDSNMVLEYLRDENKKGISYDILLINCGLHDIRVDRSTNRIQTEKKRYEDNLNQICEAASEMSQRVFWISTTPVVDRIHYDHVHFTEEVRALQAAFISGCLLSIG